MNEYEWQFKALSEPKRIEIIRFLLQNGQTCVCDLAEKVQMTQSKLSYHLKILLASHLITKEQIGTWNYYQANQTRLQQLLSVQAYRSICLCEGGESMNQPCCEDQKQPCCEEQEKSCCVENKKECCESK